MLVQIQVPFPTVFVEAFETAVIIMAAALSPCLKRGVNENFNARFANR